LLGYGATREAAMTGVRQELVAGADVMPYLGDTVTWLSNKHIDPDTPAGLCKALGIGADICLTGAKRLDDASSGWDLPDRQILAFHALELALKAFLAKHGLTRRFEKTHMRTT
jgi:hypothetical protein